MQFEVQTQTVCGGWVNMLTEDDIPIHFKKREDAEEELDLLFRGLTEAGMDFNRDDYRIAELACEMEKAAVSCQHCDHCYFDHE